MESRRGIDRNWRTRNLETERDQTNWRRSSVDSDTGSKRNRLLRPDAEKSQNGDIACDAFAQMSIGSKRYTRPEYVKADNNSIASHRGYSAFGRFDGKHDMTRRDSGHITAAGRLQCTGHRTDGKNRGTTTRFEQPDNTLQRLQQLETEEPSQALLALASTRSGLYKFYTHQQLRDSRLIELLIKVLQNVCRASHSPKLLGQLLKDINETGFLTNHVVPHLITANFTLGSSLIISICDILKSLLHYLPSSSLPNVTILLAQLTSWADERRKSLVSSMHSEALDAIRSVDEMTKSTAKQIRGGDVLRDQEKDSEQDEEPPDDFRQIPTCPTVYEIKSEEPPFLRKNIIYGAYRDVDHYLDVQYRLLREDFVCPLREGLKTLQEYKDKKIPLNRLSDIRFYSNVRIAMPYCTNKSVLYRIHFDVSNFRRVRWESSKRLIFGSLVGLSKDNFANISFGTVAARQPELLCKGIVDICFEDENTHLLDPNPFTEYQMVECSAYFEAYRHVLQGLQEIQPDSLPFENYILNKSNIAEEVRAPRYLRAADAQYDFQTLCDGDHQWKRVPVLDLKSWPKAEKLGLDQSQYTALQTALTKEFVTIQGPPGTGKTFIGLKIVQLLLDNKRYWNTAQSPILIVCYTNHALDQFLEGIIDMCHLRPGDLVRVGGRSSSEKLKACGLIEVKKKLEIHGTRYGRHAVADVLEQMTALQTTITGLVAQVEFARKQLIHEIYLQQYMTEMQARSLFNRSFNSGASLISEWLGIVYQECADDHSDDYNPDQGDATGIDEFIVEDDEDEVNRIQAERQIEGGVNLQTNNQKHIDEIKKAAKSCYLVADAEHSTESDGFQEAKSKKKNRLNKIVRNQLVRVKAMSEEESSLTGNVWFLSMVDRWRLYNYWVSCFCEEKSLHIRHFNAEYNRLTSRLNEIYTEDDYQALRQAVVVGMTTTGANKYRLLMQRIQPRIVIVEEAAEVMEAHIVTTLSSQCQHLIMIGDHQQLKPNPTVYKLSKQYHLDISLFERMVKNELRCDRLTIQHRMRPEIVQLIVPHIYKTLENHESVLSYDSIRGINGNVFFITHSEEEAGVEDTKSRSNNHEARFMASLCRYLLQQGYQPSQITVLTTYTGQMFLLRRCMPRSTFDGVRITPVDNYQGEENDIILLSLVRSNVEGKIGFLQIHNRVCVALSRAKKGLYIIGNMTILSDASSLWSEIAKDLKLREKLVEALPLACQNHPTSIIHAKTDTDFSRAPEGGCMLDCGIRLKCGHVCERKCHPVDRDHEEYKCTKPCVKILCERGHVCPKFCFLDCGKCEYPVKKIMPICGHEQTMKCHTSPDTVKCKSPCEKQLTCGHKCRRTCGQPCDEECSEIVPDRRWPCGHLLSVECSLNPDNFKCNVMVQGTLQCGHTVDLCCSDDINTFKCHTLVDRVLPCEHTVKMRCSDDLSAYGCIKMVSYRRCDDESHSYETECYKLEESREKSCQKEAKVQCSTNPNHVFMAKCCEKTSTQCPIACRALLPCGHFCSGKCGVCALSDKHQLCKAACRRKLPCDHQCTATCGESCPPCRDVCSLHCGHRQCTQPCSSQCDTCELPCRWGCVHKRCQLKCHEPCTRLPCDMPCTNSRPCGHRCIGLCGEPCVPWCGVCNNKNISQLMRHLGISNYSRKTRFLVLMPCGHVVEVAYMDEWVNSIKRTPPCEPKPVTCPLCKQRVGLCPRYNAQIKQYMIDVNTVRKAAAFSSRLNANVTRVVEVFWPTDSAAMKEILLTPDKNADGTPSFASVGLGAVCVWQECWGLLQTCSRNDPGVREYYDMHADILESIKTSLIESVATSDMKTAVKNVVIMESIYLNMHVRRLLSFIRNPRLVQLLRSLCSQFNGSKVNHLSPATCRRINNELKSNFNARQRLDIADYLQHLESFFQPNTIDQLHAQKWLVCARGHGFGAHGDGEDAECSECHAHAVGDDDKETSDGITIRDLFDSVLLSDATIVDENPLHKYYTKKLSVLEAMKRERRLRSLRAQNLVDTITELQSTRHNNAEHH